MIDRLKTIIGISLVSIAFIGTIFFKHYTGSIIKYPILIYFGFIVIGLFGLWIIYSTQTKYIKTTVNTIFSAKEDFKQKAEKIVLNIDNCEFKSGSFSHEVDDKRFDLLKAFAYPAGQTVTPTKIENIINSYLIYRPDNPNEVQHLISQSFPVDTKTLEYYVLTNKLYLYVDRFDRSRYIFDMES